MLDLSTDYLAIILIIIILWEYFFPREFILNIRKRWFNNFSLYAINIIIKWVLTFLISFTAIHIFPITDPYNFRSFLSRYLNQAEYLFLSFLLFDVFFYSLHRLFHHYQYLWRLHLVHHSDIELDVTTNFRHHPFEQLVTSWLIALFIWLGQFSIEAVSIYGVSATLIQIWHHGNISIPKNIEKMLGYLIITPSIHELHHSSCREETDSNYGAFFSIWDRIFNSFTKPNIEGKHIKITYGLEYFREQQQTLWQTLKQPFNYSNDKNTPS